MDIEYPELKQVIISTTNDISGYMFGLIKALEKVIIASVK